MAVIKYSTKVYEQNMKFAKNICIYRKLFDIKFCKQCVSDSESNDRKKKMENFGIN